MWQRRAFLAAAGAGFAAGLLPRQALALERSELVFASAVQLADGAYGAVLLGEAGELIASIALPDRGHDVTISAAAGRGVVFARQPGTFAVVFDPAGREAPVTLTSVAGRHFFGHGVFSPDGRLLYATESDFEAAQGVVGIFDATDGYRRIGEFPTFGTGPHEMLLMPDGVTLGVAAPSSTLRPWTLPWCSLTGATGAWWGSCGWRRGCTSCRSGIWRSMGAGGSGSAASSRGRRARARSWWVMPAWTAISR